MLTLRSGRQVGYAEYGLEGGVPVFYFHGNPGSRLEGGIIDEEILRTHRIRLIAVDRPGIGMSPFLPGRTLMSWSEDVVNIADSLGLGRFAILGFSAGTPYALACAKAIADRLTHVVLVSAVTSFGLPSVTDGMAPRAYYYLKTAQVSYELARLMMAVMRFGLRKDTKVPTIAFSAPDRALLSEESRPITRNLRESCRNGGQGLAWDAALITREWGFSLASIRMPVHLWQGEVDRNTPMAMAHYLCKSIPHCTAHFCPGEGHFSIMKNCFDDIARTLVEGRIPGNAQDTSRGNRHLRSRSTRMNNVFNE